RAGARVLHACEGALSGYAPNDLPNYEGYDWAALRTAAEAVCERAKARGIWVVVGSAHPLESLGSAGELKAPVVARPHNSVYLIDDAGCLHDRYDKRFCAGDDQSGELAIYSPGDHRCVFEIDGIRC